MSLEGMWFVIGGAAQGKLDYARGLYPQALVFDENSFDALCTEGQADRVIWNHFHLCVRMLMDRGLSEQEISELVKEVLDKHPDMVVLSDEIGNGIVPIDGEERRYRDLVGRQQILIAKRAERVVRILCGIPSLIK